MSELMVFPHPESFQRRVKDNQNQSTHIKPSTFDLVVVPLVFHYALGLLRTYPPMFGLKVLRLHHRFCTRKEALPRSCSETVPDGFQLFKSLPWEDWWNDANTKSVFAYLRGSRDLELGEWRELMPTHI